MNYLKTTTAQILKARFKEILTVLKEENEITLNDFVAFVIKNEPDYDCIDGMNRIRATFYGKTPDLRLTELIGEYQMKKNLTYGDNL